MRKIGKFLGISVLAFMTLSIAMNDPLTTVVLAIFIYAVGSIWFKRRRFVLDQERFLYDIGYSSQSRWPKTD